MEQENVIFSKRAKQGEKPDMVKVPWMNRFNYNKEGYSIIGNRIGVRRKKDENGKIVNERLVLTDFDSCREIHENLDDDDSVYVRGSIDYSSYQDDKGNKKVSIKLVPNQVSLCSEAIDFNEDGYEQKNNFNQVIIFMGINKERDDNDKDTGRFIVSAKIVTYKTIEDVEFIVENGKLANTFRKNLKPYNAIKVSGRVVSRTLTEEVEVDDEWGEADQMTKVRGDNRREFIITGADKSTLDTSIYNEQNIEEAMMKIAQSNKADSDYGNDSNDNWGSSSNIDDNDEDEAW